MKPIVEITEALGACKYVTISMLWPLLYKLLNKVLKNCDSDCRLVKMMKLKMKEILHDHYTDSVLDLLSKAAFLDPCFKSLTFVTDSEREHIEDHITSEAANCWVVETDTTMSSGSAFRGERKLLHILEDVVQPQASDTDIIELDDDNEKARREVVQYSADVVNQAVEDDRGTISILYSCNDTLSSALTISHKVPHPSSHFSTFRASLQCCW